ncbi:hypothetical protein EZS27_011085 [termite gut metagenome]|uniref:Uncharacterized protein n=1 Tax=termite gut metagenome TaxID=433724 RepID=A0A5J4S4T6_9ZZZZ
MYVNDDYFNKWMEKLFNKMSEIVKSINTFVNINEVFDKGDKILDKLLTIRLV